jgi:BASS family bile acid:Na+ symporter
MNNPNPRIEPDRMTRWSAGTNALLHWVQRRLLYVLIATYVLGIVAPGLGLALRSVRVGRVGIFGDAGIVSVPMLMLGGLLVVAGLGVRFDELMRVLRRPLLVIAGIATNTLYPIVFTVLASALLFVWPEWDEAQSILVGLAMIGAMPIAGASTAWSQNAEGNVALSLGLVWVSTLVSPLLTPLGLHAIALVTGGDYSEDLHELAGGGSSAFIVLAVLIPSLLGLALRVVVPHAALTRAMPLLKLANLVNLLVLNYSNAAAALPQLVRDPDWDFLALVIVLCSAMCTGAFVVGWLVPRAFAAPRADQLAMTFGIGMNNNGTGLVLATAALADHPLVLVPIITYNLAQQIVAGVVDARTHP